MAHDVFISHAVEDKRVADEVCRALEAAGFKCWYAPRDVPLGVDYEEAIMDAIVASPLLVLLLSAHSNKSQHVKREIQNALVEDSPTQIISLRIEDVPYSKALRYYLGSTQWLDASTPPLEAHLHRLVEYVRARLPRPDQPRPEPPLPPPREVVWERPAVPVAPLKSDVSDRAGEAQPERSEWFTGGRKVWAVSGLAVLVGAVALALALSGRACDAGGPANNSGNLNQSQLAAATPPAPSADSAVTPSPNAPANSNAASPPSNRNANSRTGSNTGDTGVNRNVSVANVPTPRPANANTETSRPCPSDREVYSAVVKTLAGYNGFDQVGVNVKHGYVSLVGVVMYQKCKDLAAHLSEGVVARLDREKCPYKVENRLVVKGPSDPLAIINCLRKQ